MEHNKITYEASLYICNLNEEIDEFEIYNLCSPFGELESVMVVRDKDKELKSLGSAYVNFLHRYSAENALKKLHSLELRGQQLCVMWNPCDKEIYKAGSGNIFIKNLPISTDPLKLYQVFSPFGKVHSCKIFYNKSISMGFGLVHFENEASVEPTLKHFSTMSLSENAVSVCKFQNESELDTLVSKLFVSLYVKRFSNQLDETGLKELFQTCGEVKSVKVMRDSGGKSLGFGYVNMYTHYEAEKAVEELNGKTLENGDTLCVERLKTKEERSQKVQVLSENKSANNPIDHDAYTPQSLLNPPNNNPITRPPPQEEINKCHAVFFQRALIVCSPQQAYKVANKILERNLVDCVSLMEDSWEIDAQIQEIMISSES